MFTIPDKGEPANDIQAILFEEDLGILLAGINGAECVLSGCDVSAQGAPDMTLAVAKGAVLTAGLLAAVTAGNVTIDAADASNPRIDLVVAGTSGTKAVRKGTPAAAPKPPARSAGDVALAMVFVPAADTSIEADKVTDKRVIRGGAVAGGGAPVLIYKSASNFAPNNTIIEQPILSLSIPAGLFASQHQILRVRAGGNYLGNSGTSTWTWRIKFGGTTMFQDVTVATTNDADRGAWYVEFELVAKTSLSQRVVGNISFQTPGAKTAPLAGVGDLAVATHINAPIHGSAAVDANAADRLLELTVQHSVANAAVETLREFVMVEMA